MVSPPSSRTTPRDDDPTRPHDVGATHDAAAAAPPRYEGTGWARVWLDDGSDAAGAPRWLSTFWPKHISVESATRLVPPARGEYVAPPAAGDAWRESAGAAKWQPAAGEHLLHVEHVGRTQACEEGAVERE